MPKHVIVDVGHKWYSTEYTWWHIDTVVVMQIKINTRLPTVQRTTDRNVMTAQNYWTYLVLMCWKTAGNIWIRAVRNGCEGMYSSSLTSISSGGVVLSAPILSHTRHATPHTPVSSLAEIIPAEDAAFSLSLFRYSISWNAFKAARLTYKQISLDCL